jgi:hypothetical protein
VQWRHQKPGAKTPVSHAHITKDRKGVTKVKRTFKTLILVASVGAALAVSPEALAESTSVTGAGTITTNARQDFQVVIPRFLQFRVGVAGAGISLVNCDMSANAAVLGDGTDQACAGGDVGGGVSNVAVRSNAGQISLVVTTLGSLSNGVDNMPFSEILTGTSTGNLPAPVLTTGATSPAVNVVLNAGVITDRTATWTYTYNNSAVYAPGTYGGVGVNNGRATYTASSP